MIRKKLLFGVIQRINLVNQIIIGLFLGSILAITAPRIATSVGLFGTLFVTALKSVAPVLVLVLVASSIASHKKNQNSRIRPIILLYLFATFAASLTAVIASFLFPIRLESLLPFTANIDITPPKSINTILMTLLLKMVDNPFNAIIQANYIGILVWGVGLGIALRQASDTTKMVVNDLSYSITFIVKVIIRFAPVGIFGLIASTLATTGFSALLDYAQLLIVLISCMLFVALIINPLIVFAISRNNPYPLVFKALRESGIPAFFTRSSAANIPVNMAFCKKMGFNEETYSIAVPLGATINMSGAAITISVLTLAAVHTLNIDIDPLTALLLSIVAAVCACGASGVAGGSLLLIPVSCSLFGIDNNIAMQVVAIGFIIGVVQDSLETAVNSSTDVIFIGAICKLDPKTELVLKTEV